MLWVPLNFLFNFFLKRFWVALKFLLIHFHVTFESISSRFWVPHKCLLIHSWWCSWVTLNYLLSCSQVRLESLFPDWHSRVTYEPHLFTLESLLNHSWVPVESFLNHSRVTYESLLSSLETFLICSWVPFQSFLSSCCIILEPLQVTYGSSWFTLSPSWYTLESLDDGLSNILEVGDLFWKNNFCFLNTSYISMQIK